MREGCNQNANRGVRRQVGRSLAGMALVVGGVVLGQIILYGPSLVGSKLLLPLDFLAQPGVYLPPSAEGKAIVPHNFVLSDLVLLAEPNRQFALSEIRAGRWPTWTPYQFAGSPFAAYAKYSPFGLLGSCVASPVVLAWSQLLLAVAVGMGAYLFCRRVLKVGLWPAILAAWCWPLSGYFVFWQGYSAPFVVGWFPWILWAVNAAVRRTSRWAGAGLAVATYLVLTSGQLDVSGQVLLASGLYAVWCFIDEHGGEGFLRRVVPGLITVTSGWLLGFLLAAPYWLPVLEYSQTGARMARRSQGETERPPVGLAALPQTVLPDMYGSTQDGSLWMPPEDEQKRQLRGKSTGEFERQPTPACWPRCWWPPWRGAADGTDRSIVSGWLLGFLGLSWCLDVPGVVDLLRSRRD